MEVWYDPKVIMNVISFADLQAQFPVYYNNEDTDEFRVKTDRGILKFTGLRGHITRHALPSFLSFSVQKNK
jgi:hypothetical protein